MAARLLFSILAACFLAASTRTTWAGQLGSGITDVLQVMADLTLIDGACPDDVVNFGTVFRFTAENGVPGVEMMPGGPRRSAFETVLRARRASFDRDELCGEIAANYAEALPGSVGFRPGAGARP